MAQQNESELLAGLQRTTRLVQGIYQETWTAVEQGRGNRYGAILHGLGEHSGRYHRSLPVLFASGEIDRIQLMDFTGHGQSLGKRGDAPEGLKTYVQEVQHFLRAHPDISWIWGHSMGGLALFNALETFVGSLQVRCIVLTAPSFQVVQAPNFLQRLALPVLRALRASLTLPTSIQAFQITSLSDEQQRYRSDPRVHCRISVRLYESLLACAQNYEDRLVALLQKYPQLRIFIAHGNNDTIASVSACDRLREKFQLLSPEVGQRMRIRVYPNSRHEIHHDRDREAFFQDFLSWVFSPERSYRAESV